MRLVIEPEAVTEIGEAYCYYKQISPGLGRRLALETAAGLAQIKLRPDAWPHIRRGYRHYTLSRFPYMIVYKVQRDSITVAAFFHHKRSPKSLTSRL